MSTHISDWKHHTGSSYSTSLKFALEYRFRSNLSLLVEAHKMPSSGGRLGAAGSATRIQNYRGRRGHNDRYIHPAAQQPDTRAVHPATRRWPVSRPQNAAFPRLQSTINHARTPLYQSSTSLHYPWLRCKFISKKICLAGCTHVQTIQFIGGILSIDKMQLTNTTALRYFMQIMDPRWSLTLDHQQACCLHFEYLAHLSSYPCIRSWRTSGRRQQWKCANFTQSDLRHSTDIHSGSDVNFHSYKCTTP
jgi:hypothetical protein